MKTKLQAIQRIAAILWIAPTRRTAGMRTLVTIIALALFSCSDGGGGNSSSACKCADKAHLGIGEQCSCGGNKCVCTLQEYGKLGGVIPIYRKGNVADGSVNATATKVQSMYVDPTLATVLGQLIGKVDAIYVISGHSADKNGKILEIGCDAVDSDIVTLLVNTAVSNAIIPNNKIKLATERRVPDTNTEGILRVLRTGGSLKATLLLLQPAAFTVIEQGGVGYQSVPATAHKSSAMAHDPCATAYGSTAMAHDPCAAAHGSYAAAHKPSATA